MQSTFVIRHRSFPREWLPSVTYRLKQSRHSSAKFCQRTLGSVHLIVHDSLRPPRGRLSDWSRVSLNFGTLSPSLCIMYCSAIPSCTTSQSGSHRAASFSSGSCLPPSPDCVPYHACRAVWLRGLEPICGCLEPTRQSHRFDGRRRRLGSKEIWRR